MRTAIVYYSLSGNTHRAAELLAEETHANLIRLEPEKAYPDKGFRKFFQGGKSAVMEEKPVLQPYSFDPERYELIILGFPVWAGNVAPPIRTFAEENAEALQNKRIAAFACQSGNGAERAFRKLLECLNRNSFVSTLILTDPKDRPRGDEKQNASEFIRKCADLR